MYVYCKGEGGGSNFSGLFNKRYVLAAIYLLVWSPVPLPFNVYVSPCSKHYTLLSLPTSCTNVGLTDAEIEKAVQLAEQQGTLAPASANQNAIISRPAGAPPLPPRPPVPPPRERSWSE